MATTNVNHFLALLGRSSIEAGFLVVLVLAMQWIFRGRLTPRWRCTLWLLVVVRLLLPFSFSSTTSVFNLVPRWTRPESDRSAETASLVSPVTINPERSRLPLHSPEKRSTPGRRGW